LSYNPVVSENNIRELRSELESITGKTGVPGWQESMLIQKREKAQEIADEKKKTYAEVRKLGQEDYYRNQLKERSSRGELMISPLDVKDWASPLSTSTVVDVAPSPQELQHTTKSASQRFLSRLSGDVLKQAIGPSGLRPLYSNTAAELA